MFARLSYLRTVVSGLWHSVLLPLVAIAIALGTFAGTAEAGIVTSMSGDGAMSSAGSSDGRSTPHSEPAILEFNERLVGLFELPQNTGGTSSPSSTSTSGPSHSLAAATDTVLLGGLPRSGWITPEAVQALPLLLPSGLFRPPCANELVC